MDFTGKVVLITGGGAGIGRSVAEQFAAAGANVAVADINRQAAEQVVEAIDASAGRAIAIAVDCGDTAQIDAMVDTVVRTFGRIDVLVNNAAITHIAGLMDISEDDFDRINRVNGKGAFFCLQRCAREMIGQGGGRIVNMASIAGRGYAGTTNVAYAATKGALITLTRIAAHQLAQHDINVNAVCPGVTITELFDKVLHRRSAEEGIPFEDLVDSFTRPIPLGRANEPADIAAMTLFLASDGARNITGQSFNVDGGLVMS